jgi:hypothetical protein
VGDERAAVRGLGAKRQSPLMTRPANRATSGVASTIEGGSCAFQRVKQIDSKLGKAEEQWGR